MQNLPGLDSDFGVDEFASSTTPMRSFEGEQAAPLEALKSVVSGYVNLVRRAPACGPLLFSERETGPAKVETGSASVGAFETIFSHVRAAQREGALKSGDPEDITTLIVGAIAGTADLSQSRKVRAASGVHDLLSLPLFLIDRLAVVRGN